MNDTQFGIEAAFEVALDEGIGVDYYDSAAEESFGVWLGRAMHRSMSARLHRLTDAPLVRFEGEVVREVRKGDRMALKIEWMARTDAGTARGMFHAETLRELSRALNAWALETVREVLEDRTGDEAHELEIETWAESTGAWCAEPVA